MIKNTTLCKNLFIVKNISYYICVFILSYICFILNAEAMGNINKAESVPLYIGVQYDYLLNKKLRNKKLKFEGSYRKYTRLKYNSVSGIIRFFPRNKGISALNIKDVKGNILKKLTLTILRTDLKQAIIEIRSLLSSVDGIKINILNNRILIDGEILVPRDMKRIHEVVREYGAKATSIVTLSPLAQKKIADFMQRKIAETLRESTITPITVEASNMVFILSGSVSSVADKNKAQEIAEIYLPDLIVDRAVVESKVKERRREPILNHIIVKEKAKQEIKKLIELIVHYVELNKDYSDSFRFQWTPQIADNTKFTFRSGGAGGLGSAIGIISGTISNFLPKLNWAKSFGFANILHRSSIVTEEGKNASISSRKQTPYQASAGKDGAYTTATASTGIQLTFTPQIIGQKIIQLTGVKFKITNLVGSVGKKPITTVREISTSIHVKNGDSAIVGGVNSNKAISGYNRDPPGDGKPLISFLTSKGFNRSHSQFVVFITPTIKTLGNTAEVRRVKRKFRVSRE